MSDVVAKLTTWLSRVFAERPGSIGAIYVECGDTWTPEMVHLVCFNAFGFTSLANGAFDPSNPSHVGELGEFTWEPADECRFVAEEHPTADWLSSLNDAARSPDVMSPATAQGILFIIGEHDGPVAVISDPRRSVAQ